MSRPASSWPPPRIESARLLLRPPVYVDGPSLHEVPGDPEVCRFLPCAPSASLAATRRAIALWTAAVEIGVATCAICLRTAVRQPFGLVQAQRRAGDPDVGPGVMLASRAWGSGFAPEAIEAVRLAAPPALTIRLWGSVDAENREAVAMLSRIGAGASGERPGVAGASGALSGQARLPGVPAPASASAGTVMAGGESVRSSARPGAHADRAAPA